MLVRVMRFRPGLLAVVLPCLLLAIAPGSVAAQSGANAGECVETASQGTVKQYRCRLGPVRVGPFQVLTKELILGIPKPALDGYVTDMSVDVVDTRGRPMPISRLMLHHIVFGNLGDLAALGSKRDPTCPGGFLRWNTKETIAGLAERFYAAGEERAKMKLPPGYGYPIASQDSWFMTYMFMNHRSKTDTAYVEYNLTVDTRANLTPVDPYWLDVENCKVDPVYDVPGGGRTGSTHVKTMNWRVPEAGRLVAAGGHVHGGGKALALVRPECPTNAREIYTSRPVWGLRSHPFYNVKPVLHEPGPINMSGFYSAKGVPLAAGERVVLQSRYDASQPHTRVMGIMIAYFAPDASANERCAARPGDMVQLEQPRGRRTPPHFRVPIVGVRNGKPVNITAPPGRRVALGRRGTVEVGDLFFRRPNVSLPAGGTLTWRFNGSGLHNITLANGPRGFSSPNLSDGRTYSKKLSVPGTYQLFCGLHPIDMTATIKVKRKTKSRK
jgi:plastocyanin